MKRFLSPTVALVTLLLGLCSNAQADDLKDMAGKWKVQTAEAGGKALESGDMADLVVTISGDRYEVQVKDKTDRGTLKLDEAQKPKTMDATDTEGEDVGKVIKAIYELKGDTLRVCYAFEGDRPKEFATKADAPILLVTYRREK